jgi:AraC-like DNA-binding protein
MLFKSFTPSASLREHIKEYLMIHLVFDDNTRLPVKNYPANPEEGIWFTVRGNLFSQDPVSNLIEERPTITIFGQPSKRQNLIVTNVLLLLKIRFQPGGLFRLLGIPMTELLDKNYEADLIIGKEINEINEQLMYAANYEEMIGIVDKYFEKKFNQIKRYDMPVDKIGQYILQKPLNFNLVETARQACLSISRFEKRFEQRIGTTPKYYARLCRFFQAYEMKEYNPALDWLSIAIHNGYHDYQHLVKDFKQFAGTTPAVFLEECRNNPERVLNLPTNIIL